MQHIIMQHSEDSNPDVAIVVPTLATRIVYLEQALASIRDASIGHIHICIVGPSTPELTQVCERNGVEQFVNDPGKGLAHAINFAAGQLPSSIKIFNWLGDDDLLMPLSIDFSRSQLILDDRNSFVYGACDYIDQDGEILWTNKSGRYTKYLMRFGPQLIPQPGALMRKSAFDQIGGCNTRYKFAFDLDLFIKLSQIGHALYIPNTLAAFRWHSDSLSVGGRRSSVDEASAIRRDHLPSFLAPISFIWEPIIRNIIFFAGVRMTKQSKKISK